MITDRDIAMCTTFHPKPLRELPVSGGDIEELARLPADRFGRSPGAAKEITASNVGDTLAAIVRHRRAGWPPRKRAAGGDP